MLTVIFFYKDGSVTAHPNIMDFAYDVPAKKIVMAQKLINTSELIDRTEKELKRFQVMDAVGELVLSNDFT